ncbi:MAG: GatB/YqeY domain-containing protein [Acidobacteriota bacterium]
MSTPQEQIQSDIKEALKAKQSERLATLRMLLSEIKNEKIRAGEEVDDEGFTRLVRKAVKQRKDSAEQYRNGDREELAAKEEREIEILSVYLPAQVGDDEIRQAIEDFVAAEGLSGPQGIGPVMKAMLGRFGGSADGKTINQIARSVLTGS